LPIRTPWLYESYQSSGCAQGNWVFL